MHALKIVLLTLALSSVAQAEPLAFNGTGKFFGTGRLCDGDLIITAKTITWDTPYSACLKSPYKVIENDLKNIQAPKIVYQLLKSKACAFGVIVLDWNSEYPRYWNATGYRSLEAYNQRSDDTLQCSVLKR